MQTAEFERMVARLEAKSRNQPATYQANVALLALLGFALLALVVGAASTTILALVAVPVAMWMGGLHAYGLFVGVSKLLLLLALPLWFLIKSTLSALLTRLPPPQGLELQRHQAPALFAALDEMRRKMKGPHFHHVLLSHELNAAMVQRPLFGLFGPPRNFLIVGLPLLDSLSPEEALSVVAHEYGHLAGSHGHFAAFIYRLRISWGTVYSVSHQWTGYAGRALRRLVGLYAPYFNAYSFVLARANEYQADAAAARLVSAGVMASALIRVEVFGTHFSKFMQRTYQRAKDCELPPDDVFSCWTELMRNAPVDDANRCLRRALAIPGGVGDTHPPLRARLKALFDGDEASISSEAPAGLASTSAAQAWLGANADGVRKSVQASWYDRVANPWKQEYEEANEQRERLERLRGLDQPTEKERGERLRLQLEYAPQAMVVADLDSFIVAYPENALGYFLLGCWRLTNEDDSGLECLDRAMRLDAGATKPVCEKALAYLSERDDARTDVYHQLWQDRDHWEREVEPQLTQLDSTHELRVSDLSEDAMNIVIARMQANRSNIVRAFLVRRLLPADPTISTYLLALELEPARSRRESPREIVDRVIGAEPWPMHLIVAVLDGKYKALKPRIIALSNSEIPLREQNSLAHG